MNLFPWRKRKPVTDAPSVDSLIATAVNKALAQSVSERDLLRLIRGANPQTASDVDESTYLRAYQTSLWANACTVAIADGCAAVPIKLRRHDTKEEIERHEILDLLEYTNEKEDWPWFIGAMVSYRQLAGEAFIILGPTATKPRVMYQLRPDRMTPKVSGGRVTAWTYKAGTSEVTFKAEEVIQCKRWSPTNDLRGQPVLQAGEISLNLDLAVRKYNNTYLRGGAIPPFAILAAGKLNEDQADQIARAWEKKHGSIDKAGKPFVHGDGLKLEILSDGKKEGAFVDLAKLSKQEILALFKVPPIIVGDYSDASVLANAAIQEKQFWRRTILGGEMKQILGTLNEQLVPRWDRNLELYADEASMPELQEDEGTHWARITEAVGGPWLEVNEGRALAGLEPVDGGDVVYVDPLKLPLGSAPPQPVPIPVPAEAAPAEEPPPAKRVSIIPVRHKSLVGAFGSEAHQAHYKAYLERLEPQVVRMRKVVAELNADLLAEVLAKLDAEAGKGHQVTSPDFRSKAVVDRYLFDLRAAGKVFAAKLMPQVGNVLEDGAGRAIAELGGGTFTMERPEVVAWLQAKKLKIVTLPKGLYDSIRGHLTAGVQSGETVRDIANRLRDMEPTYKGSFAERVARTEVVGANNAGSLECYRQNDVKQKEWSTAEDEDVRDDHKAAHGQVVAIDKPFIVGGQSMDAPGDQSAGPEQCCNCRCAVLPVVD